MNPLVALDAVVAAIVGVVIVVVTRCPVNRIGLRRELGIERNVNGTGACRLVEAISEYGYASTETKTYLI